MGHAFCNKDVTRWNIGGYSMIYVMSDIHGCMDEFKKDA